MTKLQTSLDAAIKMLRDLEEFNDPAARRRSGSS
jgi:hypothetical protein